MVPGPDRRRIRYRHREERVRDLNRATANSGLKGVERLARAGPATAAEANRDAHHLLDSEPGTREPELHEWSRRVAKATNSGSRSSKLGSSSRILSIRAGASWPTAHGTQIAPASKRRNSHSIPASEFVMVSVLAPALRARWLRTRTPRPRRSQGCPDGSPHHSYCFGARLPMDVPLRDTARLAPEFAARATWKRPLPVRAIAMVKFAVQGEASDSWRLRLMTA